MTDQVIAILIPLFWVVIGVGLVVAIIRGVRKRRLKSALAPLGGAADAYNEALIGKTGVTELNESFHQDDKAK